MNKIIAFSAKKQGGKTTAVKYFLAQLEGVATTHNFADALKIIVVYTFVPAEVYPKGMSAVEWVEDNKDFVCPCGMTIRQLLQILGTDVFRAMWEPVWINAWKHRLPADGDGVNYILVGDVRFPNEVKAVQDKGGKVIRFSRAPFAEDDQHTSETALDGWGGFDAVIDNADMTIEEQNQTTEKLLLDKGWL